MNALSILILIAAIPAQAQRMTAVEHRHDAPQVVRATGVGRPSAGRSAAQARLMAKRAAEVGAMRNLMQKIAGEQPRTGTEEVITEGFISGFTYHPPVYRPDGSCEVTAEISVGQLHANYRTQSHRVAQLEAAVAQTRDALREQELQAEQARREIEIRLQAVQQQLDEIRQMLANLPDERRPTKSKARE